MNMVMGLAFVVIVAWIFRMASSGQEKREEPHENDEGLGPDDDVEVMYDEEAWLFDDDDERFD